MDLTARKVYFNVHNIRLNAIVHIYTNICIHSRAMFVIGPAGPTTNTHDCHHDTKVKPEAATAVTELLMMGGKTPETR
jgi:hypothetical protein